MGRCLNHVNHYRPGYCRLAGSEICGRTVFSRLSDIPVHIDMVDVLRRPHYLADIVEQAIELEAGAMLAI